MLKQRDIKYSQNTSNNANNQKERVIHDYGKMKVGLKTVEDAILNIDLLNKQNKGFYDKNTILNAIERSNLKTQRDISKYFFKTDGIYQRLCKYLAYLYRYDWYITPFVLKKDKAKEDKVINDFSKVLFYIDESNVKQLFGDIALSVVIEGCYYGVVTDSDESFSIQQLPPNYCRSRFTSKSNPIVEMDMRFFDDNFTDVNYRLKILKTFPKDIQKGYILYKEGKLNGDYPGDQRGWFTIDSNLTVKFSLTADDSPMLIGSIPSLIDLDMAQEMDRRKTMQGLLKILVQKLPLNKNDELIFDIEEARDIHNNAVAMLRRAVGVDVITTFADVDSIDTSDRNTTTTKDDLEKVERTVYNNLGVSQNLFNTSGNMALEKSVANDEALMKDLVYQFEFFLNRMIKKFDKKNQYKFKAGILETTIYNYKELSKMYKEQTQIGFSKMLPQIALGHEQSSIVATAYFENEVLRLSDIMIPPMMSSTMSSSLIKQNKEEEKSKGGRPEKSNEEKSDKTIKNEEAMS